MVTPRRPSTGVKGFIWIPRIDPISWKVYVNNVEVTTDIIESEFTKSLCPDIGQFKITLINADGAYTNSFLKNQIVLLKADLVDGSTAQFRGQIDNISFPYDAQKGYTIQIEGGHIDLFNVLVTENYSDINLDGIFKDLVTKYMVGYTTTNVASTTVTGSFNWENKYFWDCINDLCKKGFDAFLDENYDFHFFVQNSIENNNEAIVWNDTLVDTSGIGEQIVTVKNKVRVVGDDGTGLPVLATAQSTDNQALYGIKETVINDNKINDINTATDAANSTLNNSILPTTTNEGQAEALIMPTLDPGELIWITNPPMNLHGQFKAYSLTHKFPIERTLVNVTKERGTKQILKKRVENETALQQSKNPYRMTDSWNKTFDSITELASYDANVRVSGGIVSLSSGTQGIFTISTTTAYAPTYIQLKAIGTNLSLITFQISFDNGSSYQTLTLEALNTITSSSTNIIMRITLTNVTELDSLALLYKQ